MVLIIVGLYQLKLSNHDQCSDRRKSLKIQKVNLEMSASSDVNN